jgi:hypothetical protein
MFRFATIFGLALLASAAHAGGVEADPLLSVLCRLIPTDRMSFRGELLCLLQQINEAEAVEQQKALDKEIADRARNWKPPAGAESLCPPPHKMVPIYGCR